MRKDFSFSEYKELATKLYIQYPDWSAAQAYCAAGEFLDETLKQLEAYNKLPLDTGKKPG